MLFSMVADSFIFYCTCRVEQSTLLALVAKALLRTATLHRIVLTYETFYGGVSLVIVP